MQRHPLIFNLFQLSFQIFQNCLDNKFHFVIFLISQSYGLKWCPVIKDTNFVSRCQEKTFTLIIVFGYSKASNTWLMYRKPVTGSKNWSSIYRSTELDGFEIGEVTEVCN